MSKKNFIAAVPVAVDGVATVSNQRQEDALNNDRITYVPGRGYMTVPQKAHKVAVSFNGQQFDSKRVFAVEVMKNDNGEIIPTGSFTYLRINGIRQTHYGEVKEGEAAPVIKTVMNEEGRLRTEGAPLFRAVQGSHGLGCREKVPFVKFPNIFWFNGEKTVYVPQFENQAMQADENGDLILTTQVISTFTAEPASGEIAKIKLGDLVDLKDPKYAELAAEE
jgi:hypothetical protein